MKDLKDRLGPCPLRSEEILRFALNGLRERDVLKSPSYEFFISETEKLAKMLPDHYLPDIYIELPLKGDMSEGMAAVFDCYDRCWLDYRSEGKYFRDLEIPAMTEPGYRDSLRILYPDGSYAAAEKSSFVPAEEAAFPPGLAELPVLYREEGSADGSSLLFTTGTADVRHKYTKRYYTENIQQILREAGISEEKTGLLKKAAYNCGVPYLHPEEGYQEWTACLDVAAFRMTVRHDQVTGCSAVICISDRSISYSRQALKPTQAYQWHITDDCDQRCKHCYLFAEDARLKCISTPYDQLIHTLDETEKDAAARHGLAMPVLSGGDPILHPQFWEFAEELHRRGLHWSMMGNPFHLTEEVCKRLHDLGCYKYQQSMDGLEEFHDYMRKPGSFRATLDAVDLLKKAGIQTQLMATVSRQNMDDIIECMDIAAEHGITFFTFARYCATSPEKVKESYPSPQEYRDFLLRYYEKRRAYMEKNCRTRFQLKEHLFTLLQYELGEFVIPEYARKHPELVFDGCHLGQSCAILPNGDLMACRRMESVIGNVNESSIRDILCSEECMKYTDVSKIKKCRDCELLSFCRGCRAVGFNASGDLQGEDPMCWKEVKEEQK